MRRRDAAAAPSGLVWSRSHERERALSGVVTLALLAILLAFIVRHVLKRMGMGMSHDRTIALMVIFVIVVLMLWGQQTTGK